MARPLRIELAGGLYHVTSRGDRRENIYFSDEDRLKWLELRGCLQTVQLAVSYVVPNEQPLPSGCRNALMQDLTRRSDPAHMRSRTGSLPSWRLMRRCVLISEYCKPLRGPFHNGGSNRACSRVCFCRQLVCKRSKNLERALAEYDLKPALGFANDVGSSNLNENFKDSVPAQVDKADDFSEP